MSGHTPGPWFILDQEIIAGTHIALVADADDFPCREGSEDLNRELKANANLIAAAPDLLEACKSMLEHFDPVCDYRKDGIVINMARMAIQKAEGVE